MAINIHKILSDTLLELCKEKKLQSITVQDILKRSGVSRQAFYNRFRDKYELIQWTYLHNILCDFLNNGPYGSVRITSTRSITTVRSTITATSCGRRVRSPDRTA